MKPKECEGCSLHTLGNSFSQPEGQGRLGVFLIGEIL